MDASSAAVVVQDVRKSFRLPIEPTNSLRRTLTNYFKGIKGYRTQEVLKDISFTVEQGDFFGIVGRNGSGKSTLLKIISQIYTPDQGIVIVNGKLVSFIELGVGFNPELTGRENVYLNGAFLGFSPQEIDGMYDEIVDFAELGEFMNQKLKNYSSGMQVRLAFAVAINSQSDILVLDEVLAVGDEAFQRKCNDYFMQMKETGKTIILVTHSMEAVRKYCNRALLIEDGYVKALGTPDEVTSQYSLDNAQKSNTGAIPVVAGSVSVKNLAVQLLTENLLDEDRTVTFHVDYEVLQDTPTFVAFSLTDIDRNVELYSDNSYDYMTEGPGYKQIEYTCSLDNLNRCKLRLDVSIQTDQEESIAFADADNAPIVIIAPKVTSAKSEQIAASGIVHRNGIWSA